MALMGFSIQSLGAVCLMIPNETPDPVETSLLTEQADCHGDSKKGAIIDLVQDLMHESVKVKTLVMSDDCCNGSCLIMSCQAVTAIDAASVYSIFSDTIHLVPSAQVDSTSTLINVLFRPPILS